MIRGETKGPLRVTSQPRSVVKLNGIYVPFHMWTVNLNGYSAADTFDVTLPFFIVNNLGGISVLASTPSQESTLFTDSDFLVEIYSGYPKNPNKFNENDLTQVMYGYMDTANFSFDEQGERVELQGRNQVAPFMDNKTTDKFPNKTSSSIVRYFAEKHGLDTQITNTYTLAGHYYASDHTTLTSDETEWDLMNYLADQEGFTLRVKENTLYFGPRDSFLNQNPFIYTWGHNLENLSLSRSPHAAKDIKVEVFSWHGTKKTRISATATNSTTYASRVQGTSAHQQYTETYYIPGLTKDQAQKRANSILNKLSMTEITGTFLTLGDEQLTIDQSIQLNGVGLPSSMQFWATQVSHTFDMEQGLFDTTVNFSNLNLPTNPGGM